jgi:nitrite reductase/ring-hydroxylating ferredoxin subunit
VGYVQLATLDELPPETALEVEHSGRVIALFRRESEVLALDGICPHQGGPLARGSVAAGILTCPWHGWQFQLDSGQCLVSRGIRQTTYAVRIEGNAILVDLS